MRILKLAPEDEAQLQSVAGHEAGHAVVAIHFGLRPRVFLASTSAGVCLYDRTVEPRIVEALSWAGALGEDILQCRSRQRTGPNVVLGPATVGEWYCHMILPHRLAELSEADQRGIVAEGPRFECCRLAFDVLWPEREYLAEYRDYLADQSRQHVNAAVARNSVQADELDVRRFLNSNQ